MRLETLTEEQLIWLDTQIKVPPTVFVLAYAGTSYKEWKLAGMFTKERFAKIEQPIVKYVVERYPSAISYKIFRVEKPTEGTV